MWRPPCISEVENEAAATTTRVLKDEGAYCIFRQLEPRDTRTSFQFLTEHILSAMFDTAYLILARYKRGKELAAAILCRFGGAAWSHHISMKANVQSTYNRSIPNHVQTSQYFALGHVDSSLIERITRSQDLIAERRLCTYCRHCSYPVVAVDTEKHWKWTSRAIIRQTRDGEMKSIIERPLYGRRVLQKQHSNKIYPKLICP